MRLFVGDRSAVLFTVNSLFLYAFAPLPFVAIGALAFRRISFLVIALSGIVAWCGFWGELFLPRDAPAAKHPLVLLSYNALGYNRYAADTVRVIQDSRADLVALQELNPETAAAIERHLHIVYPYRWLDPRDGLTGGAILSKFPFTREPAETLPGSWVGTPMVAVVDFMDTPVTFVRFHAVAGPAGSNSESSKLAHSQSWLSHAPAPWSSLEISTRPIKTAPTPSLRNTFATLGVTLAGALVTRFQVSRPQKSVVRGLLF